MIRRALLILTVLASTGGAQRANGDSVSRWVDSIFAPVTSRQGPGCAVGVTQNGVLTFAKGYGMADLEHDSPITPETPFYLASISIVMFHGAHPLCVHSRPETRASHQPWW